MSLSQLVGQRFVFALPGTGIRPALAERIRLGEAAGVILFARNLPSRSQARSLVRGLQRIPRPAAVPYPLLVMVDQEGGAIKRLAGPPTRSPLELGESGSEAEAVSEGRATANSLRRVGVNVNLAPVVDLGRPGGAIHREGRSYGGNPGTVARVAGAFARGLREGHVMPTAKHFPGLGAAKSSTDRGPVRIGLSRRALRRADELPFKTVAGSGAGLVMLSTAVYPALDERPAALSRTVVRTDLRRHARFTGVSISDDLEAPALSHLGGPEELGLRGAAAGTDLLLFARSYEAGERAALALEQAARSGTVKRVELRQSARRVISLRASIARLTRLHPKRHAP